MALDEMIKVSTAIYLVFSHLFIFIFGMAIYWFIRKIKE